MMVNLLLELKNGYRHSYLNEELILNEFNWLNIKFDEKNIRRQSEYLDCII